MSEEGKQPDPWDALESSSEILGFIYFKGGAEGLRGCLDLCRKMLWLPGSLEDNAQELEEAGMLTAGRIIREALANAPPDADGRYHPMHRDGPDNVHAQGWLKRQKAEYPDFDESKVIWDREAKLFELAGAE
jgi:hypothetical protein